LCARRADEPLQFAIAQRHRVEAAVGTRDPKAELFSIRRSPQARDIAVPRQSGLDLLRLHVEFVDAREEVAVGSEVKFLAVLRPREIRVVPRPIGKPRREFSAASGHAFRLVDSDSPDVAVQTERERLSVRRWLASPTPVVSFSRRRVGLFFIRERIERELCGVCVRYFRSQRSGPYSNAMSPLC
jgi:hypothetical protein